MQISQLITIMTQNASRIDALVEGVNSEQARWKPAPDSWSVLEVINHLYDEEREDFRVRLDIILHKPDKSWPPIDPQGWVSLRSYNERALGESLKNFHDERQASIAWLNALKQPDWEKTYQASFGSIRAGDIMASWVIHDHLHMKQLSRLLAAHTDTLVDPYDSTYAGG